jgi:hypothetical protein
MGSSQEGPEARTAPEGSAALLPRNLLTSVQSELHCWIRKCFQLAGVMPSAMTA